MKTRIGLIGCGIISQNHIDGYAAIAERAEIVAVADTDAGRAAAAAAKTGAGRQFADYRDLLAESDVDAVDICLPHHLHRPVTVAAVEAGKHVLCEKPIAASLAEADAMIDAAERAGRVLAIGENWHFLPEVEVAGRLIREGALGQVVVAQSVLAGFLGGPYLDTRWRFVADEVGGGALVDSGIHNVDVLLSLLGRPETVSCYTRRVRDFFPAEDVALVTAQFEGGALGQLIIGWSLRSTGEPLFRVYGTEGALTAHRGKVEVISERLPEKPTVFPTAPTNGFREEIAHFVECVSTGRRPAMGGPEARADLAFVLAAYESARTGRQVEVG